MEPRLDCGLLLPSWSCRNGRGPTGSRPPGPADEVHDPVGLRKPKVGKTPKNLHDGRSYAGQHQRTGASLGVPDAWLDRPAPGGHRGEATFRMTRDARVDFRSPRGALTTIGVRRKEVRPNHRTSLLSSSTILWAPKPNEVGNRTGDRTAHVVQRPIGVRVWKFRCPQTV